MSKQEDKNLRDMLGEMNYAMMNDMLNEHPVIPVVKGMASFLLEKIDEQYFTETMNEEDKKIMEDVRRNDGDKGFDIGKEYRLFKTGHFLYGLLKTLEQEGIIHLKNNIAPMGNSKKKIEEQAEKIWNDHKRRKK